jgi:hypothetical protein
MVSRREERIATGATGIGLLGVGAHLREAGVNRAARDTGIARTSGWRKTKLHHIPYPVTPAAGLRHAGSGKGRLIYGAGALAGLVGAPAVGVAVTGAVPRRHREVIKVDSAQTFIGAGLQGTTDAIKTKGRNLKEKTPLGARVVPLAVGAGAGAGGSKLAHAAFDHMRVGAKLRHPAAAVAGVLGAAASLPVSNRVLRRTNPGYVVTPTGVKRAKKPIVRPSTRASLHEGRASRGADPRGFRRQIVGKSDPTDLHVQKPLSRKYAGYGLDHKHKRALVYAAGGLPVVGSFAAASTAARLAPPEQRRKAYASQLGGAGGGKAAGAVAGGGAAILAARHSPGVQRGAERLQSKINSSQAKTGSFVRTKSPAAGRAMDASAELKGGVHRAAAALARPHKQPPGRVGRAVGSFKALPKPVRTAAALGAYGGGVLGGAVGGFKGYGHALKIEDRRNAAIRKSLFTINRTVVAPSGMNYNEGKAQLRDKKRKLRTDVANTALGISGVGLLAGKHIPKVAAKFPHLERAATHTAIASGGVSAVGNVTGIRLQRRDIRANEKQMRTVSKSQQALERHHRRGGHGTVRISTLDSYRRAPGLRFGNTNYTASLAEHLKQTGPPKSPVKVHLYRDRPFIDDGAHRMWATQMNGRKTVPVEVKRFDTKSPYARTWVGGRKFDDMRTARFRRELKRTVNLQPARIRDLARKQPTGFKARFNARAAARGEKRAANRPSVSNVAKSLVMAPKLPTINPGLRSSYIQTRRGVGGTLKPVRVAGGLVR